METRWDRKSTRSNSQRRIESGSIVADVLRDWPETVSVFLKRRLGCVGCDLSVFDTIADVARIYSFDANAFLEELKAASRDGEHGIKKTT